MNEGQEHPDDGDNQANATGVEGKQEPAPQGDQQEDQQNEVVAAPAGGVDAEPGDTDDVVLAAEEASEGAVPMDGVASAAAAADAGTDNVVEEQNKVGADAAAAVSSTHNALFHAHTHTATHALFM